MDSTAPTKIFFDGKCVVCDLEILHYKRLAPELFEIVDISSPDFDAKKYGLETAAVNKHLNVETPSGKMLKGVDAFAHIWSQIPRYQFAEKIVGLPGLNSLARIGYAVFAEVRPWLPKKQ